ncbi:MAG: class I SAM-dependent methyltransferase [Clostridium sp.]|nr:class I SAM-dependent methyltransferase [Clostridium sp.]
MEETRIKFPTWLDNYIFNELNADYVKSKKDMVVLEWGKDDILKYLGTYFPRSYTESYCIISQYIKQSNSFSGKNEISLFDFGCGTGGEIFGTLTAIIEHYPNIRQIRIFALDGNHHALQIFEKVLEKYKVQHKKDFHCQLIPITIDDFYDLSILDRTLTRKFDIVLSFKAICEFATRGRFEKDYPYAHLAKFFLPRMNGNGILVLSDITSFNDTFQKWIPKMMDDGLSKVCCQIVSQNEGYNQTFCVTHSKKDNDISKIAWRIVVNNY